MSKHSYIGIDPGFTGAIGKINAAGDQVCVWDMPTRMRGNNTRYRAYDIPALHGLLRDARMGGPYTFGLENPTTRPGDGAERMLRFGRGIGNLEACIYSITGREPEHIAPNLWKGRLGLKGKGDDSGSDLGVTLFKRYYPEHEPLLYGPRGGLKDGRLDALLIAHWMRVRTYAGGAGVVEQFGRDSAEAQALVLMGGRKKRKRKS